MSYDGKRENSIAVSSSAVSTFSSTTEPLRHDLQTIYDQLPVALALIDPRLRFTIINHYLANLFGKTGAALIGRPVSELFPDEQLDLTSAIDYARRRQPIPTSVLYCKESQQVFSIRLQATYDAQDNVSGLLLVVFEFSDQQIAGSALRESQEHYRNLVELNPQIAWTANPTGQVLDISRQFEKITGYSADIALGDSWLSCIHQDDRQRAVDSWDLAIRQGTPFDMELRLRHTGRGWSWMRTRAAASYDSAGNIVRWYGSSEDIHERKLLELKLVKANRRLEIQARTDALTRLPNRREFKKVFTQEFIRSRQLQAPLGLIMIDIDHFKLFNDGYGHLAGDACLRLVARALQKSFRRSVDLVARYGGEEFAAILPNTHEAGICLVAQQIMTAIDKLSIRHFDSNTKQITVSLGLTVYHPDQHPDDIEQADILSAADRALYLAKHKGRNQFCLMSIADI